MILTKMNARNKEKYRIEFFQSLPEQRMGREQWNRQPFPSFEHLCSGKGRQWSKLAKDSPPSRVEWLLSPLYRYSSPTRDCCTTHFNCWYTIVELSNRSIEYLFLNFYRSKRNRSIEILNIMTFLSVRHRLIDCSSLFPYLRMQMFTRESVCKMVFITRFLLKIFLGRWSSNGTSDIFEGQAHGGHLGGI